jgi:hypothetical protein
MSKHSMRFGGRGLVAPRCRGRRRVAIGELDQARANPAARLDQLDPLAAHGRQPVDEHRAIAVGQLDADHDLVGDECPGRVVLLDVLGDHRRIRQLLIFLLERAAPDELAAAHEQHGDLDEVSLAIQAPHILIDEVVLDDVLALERAFDRGQ